MKSKSRIALLASFWALFAQALVSCSSGEPTLLYEDGTEVGAEAEGEPGFLKLALTAGGQQVNSVTAVISGKHGFQTQTHNIDVSDNDGVISIFFGGLPEGKGYSIRLSAGQCTGTSNFNIQADQTTLVSVLLRCPGGKDDEDVKETGSVSVTGLIQGGGNPNAGCDHITKIVAAPSVQDGEGPSSTIEVVLHNDSAPTTIAWSNASTTGGTGVISNQSGSADTQVNFDCTTNGIVYVIANVTATSGGSSCTEQARAAIDCRNQGPTLCGNGVINPPEQCDGSVPLGQPVGTTCVNCQLVPPGVTTCNNNNIINPPEQCDGIAFPATAPLGAICTNCTISHQCGNGAINLPEQCDGVSFPGSAPLGSTCSAKCELIHQCGNGVINPPEQCDGAVLPSGQTGTCNARCQLIPPVVTVCNNNNVTDGNEQCDGTSIPATAPLGSSCLNCTLIHQCGNNVINAPEQCDGTALPAGQTGSCNNRCVFTVGQTVCGNGVIDSGETCDGLTIPAVAPLGSTCSTSCQLVHQCGNGIITAPEQCDGASIPASAPLGSICDARCVLSNQCGNGVINAPEECDGAALPPGQAGTCDARCHFTPGGGGTNLCRACVEANCVDQRAVVDANLAAVDPILDCVLGANWTDVTRVATTSCSNLDLLTCYCGTTVGQDCANAAPASLNGQCVQQILTGTGCTVSSCVAPIFLNPINNNGKAMQYAQCRADFCYPECFNP